LEKTLSYGNYDVLDKPYVVNAMGLLNCYEHAWKKTLSYGNYDVLDKPYVVNAMGLLNCYENAWKKP